MKPCGAVTGIGDDNVSCEKPAGHDDPAHQETIAGDPTMTVTWEYL